MGGIKIWVLTGDKKETALNISHSCKHFSYTMKKLFLTDLKDQDEIKIKLRQHQKKYKIKFSVGLISKNFQTLILSVLHKCSKQ
jgi:magnesium-transporting ATPase (P-type)